jgi:hypothetical protein
MRYHHEGRYWYNKSLHHENPATNPATTAKYRREIR